MLKEPKGKINQADLPERTKRGKGLMIGLLVLGMY
jgi:hypothetical protein